MIWQTKQLRTHSNTSERASRSSSSGTTTTQSTKYLFKSHDSLIKSPIPQRQGQVPKIKDWGIDSDNIINELPPYYLAWCQWDSFG
jgi:arsenate reductase-like glutaredoxin family protein